MATTGRARRARHPLTRRQLLARAGAAGGALASGGFAGASLGFLWPQVGAAFGGVVDAGEEAELRARIDETRAPVAVPAARSWLVAYDPADDPDGLYAELTGGASLMALYQRCVHLGCRVPWCDTSQWFECPCHQSRYNRWGEFQNGPAPRGLDRFCVEVAGGRLLVDTSIVVSGPPRRHGTLHQPPEGATCV